VRAVDDAARLPQAPCVGDVRADRSGVVHALPPRPIGHAIIALGGGRTTADDVVNPAVGIVFRVRVGDAVTAGQTLATVHAASPDSLAEGVVRLADIIRLGEGPPVDAPLPWVSHRVTIQGVQALAAQ
jgi:thymidine phosphorylase